MWAQAVSSDNTSCCTLESLVIETWVSKPQNIKNCLSTAGLGSQKCAQHGQRRNAQGEVTAPVLAFTAFGPLGNANHHLVTFLMKEGLKTRCNWKENFSFTEETGKKKTNLAAQNHLGL